MTAVTAAADRICRRMPFDGPLSVEQCNVLRRALAEVEQQTSTRPPATDPARTRYVTALLEAVGGVVTNEVSSALKSRGGSTFRRDGRMASFEDLVNEAQAHLLEHVLAGFDPEHPEAHWPAYAARRVRAHLKDVLREEEHDNQVSGRELTVLLAVKKLLDDDPAAGSYPSAERLKAAADEYLEQAIDERVRRDGISAEEAAERVRKNSGFRVAADIVKMWRTFTTTTHVSLDTPVGSGSETRGSLQASDDADVDELALRGLEAPAFEDLVQQLLTAGIEPEFQAVFDRLVEQRCRPERQGRWGDVGSETVSDAVRDVFERDLDGDRATVNRAKVARNRRTAVQRRAGSPHGQWAFLAYELPTQLTGDWT